MSGKVFTIADLHLGHENMAKKRGFDNAEQHDEFIIKSWNSVVRKKDVVWILGDITMEKVSPYVLLDRLNGFKKVVMGNHDKPQHARKLLEHVNGIAGMVNYKKVILTHCPVHESQFEDRFLMNIHGHLHEHIIPDTRYVCVSCERVSYIPVEIETLIIKHTKK